MEYSNFINAKVLLTCHGKNLDDNVLNEASTKRFVKISEILGTYSIAKVLF